jgi:hypothetical protein
VSAVGHICPFCRAEFSRVPQSCGGRFTDHGHPAAVRPIKVEFGADGRLLDGEEARLAEARDTYRRMGE